jgi:glucose 1-dehydrogenase
MVLARPQRLGMEYLGSRRILILIAIICAQLLTVTTCSIEGKRALVTGSAGGIGKGIAFELAKRGAQIILHYNSRETEAMEFKDQLQCACLGALHCDFRKPETIPAFFERVQECCGDGGIDILVNNAGAITKLALEDDNNSLDAWHETMAVNLHAPNLLSKLAAETMKKKDDGGVIVNVSSIHGDRSNEYMGAYAASKAALDSLTRTMAIEFAPYNIRVNAIAPGVVPVERTEVAFQDPANRGAWEDRIPLRKLGSVEAVAHACMPLIENEWITGTVWTIDGGMMSRANMPVRARPEN